MKTLIRDKDVRRSSSVRINCEYTYINLTGRYPVNFPKNRNEKFISLKEQIRIQLKKMGANEKFINEVLTDTVVQNGLITKTSAESIACALLQ